MKKSNNNDLMIIKDFFKKPCISHDFCFPKTCFKSRLYNDCNTFRFNVYLGGKFRPYTFFGKKYKEFMSDGNNIDEFLTKFRTIDSYKSSGCISYTDIYKTTELNNFNFHNLCNTKPKTHLSWIYKEYYEKFKNHVNVLHKKYKYFAYIDISDYYGNIYTHFLKGIGCENIENFNNYKYKYKHINDSNDAKWFKQNSPYWIINFFKAFEKNLNYCKETKGIAMGNGISNFVAELFNKMIDFFVHNITNELDLKTVRYRDDIYIYGNKKEDIHIKYLVYCNILCTANLFINSHKSHDGIETTKKSSPFSDEDKEYSERQKLLQNNSNQFLCKAYYFCKNNPKSNLIFNLLIRAINHDKISDKTINHLINIFNKSETNVMPYLIAFIDRYPKLYSKFSKQINPWFLSESDKIWIWCFEKKHKFKSKISNRCEELIKMFNLDKYFTDNIEDINFLHDCDKWNYG